MIGFDTKTRDAQGTNTKALCNLDFPFSEFAEHEDACLKRCERFSKTESGVLVWRRFRAPQVFADACADMQRSLELQLGGMAESIKYETDVANYLEPWYGIGVVASLYGSGYIWEVGQAPAVERVHASFEQASMARRDWRQSPIATYMMDSLEYFLEATDGRLPIAWSDAQSPLNSASHLFDTTAFFLGLLDEASSLHELLELMTQDNISLLRRQARILQNCLVRPGHGFASSRNFRGASQSDDVLAMISPDHYREFGIPYHEAVASALGGVAVHSCGNWTPWLPTVMSTRGLTAVDAAFGPYTDPDPNPPKDFARMLTGTEVVLNARIVGDAQTVVSVVRELWNPPMKMIVTTYCETPEEQHRAYQQIHEICQ